MGVVRPADPMAETVFYRNGEADELRKVALSNGTSVLVDADGVLYVADSEANRIRVVS